MFHDRLGPWTILDLINQAGGWSPHCQKLLSRHSMSPLTDQDHLRGGTKKIKRSRKHGHNPHMQAHINQSKLPNGVYFDHRGRGIGTCSTRTAPSSGAVTSPHSAPP